MHFLEYLKSSQLPNFRKQQLLTAWFDPAIMGWDFVTTLPKSLREELKMTIPWSSLKLVKQLRSETAFKALFELHDEQMREMRCEVKRPAAGGEWNEACRRKKNVSFFIRRQASPTSGKKIESVLMKNAKGEFTACLSSQVGCAMACDFCATGTMGFFRDLSTDEIVDQLRYWTSYLSFQSAKKPFRASNVVMMGMGEPLNNYVAVRDAMCLMIEHMGLGKTKITLSTVGVKRGMEELLDDPLWPDVRIAISLHYANQKKRLEHMPVARQRNLDELHDWCLRYLAKYGNRKHHLTFEYLMLQGKNDGEDDIQALSTFLKGIDRYKLNLIPWNVVNNLQYNRASRERTEAFQKNLAQHGIFATIRKSLGIEIDAGCGQLAVKETC